jgi:uncharacterized protein with HEPN domain
MEESIKKYLFDILESIKSIETFLGEKKSFYEYKQNKMLRRAIEREFEIIGEALNRLLSIDSTIQITSKIQIIGMRNRVIHGYDKVDDEIVWGTIIKHLPILKAEIINLLPSDTNE